MTDSLPEPTGAGPNPGEVLIIIPAWNEEETLPSVLAEVAECCPWADILVVNDGSQDRTAAVARAAGVRVLDVPINLGVGGAMRAGYRFAERAGYRVTFQLDADGQHDPHEVLGMIEALDAEGADIMIGSRFTPGGTYKVRGPRRWAMTVLSWTISRVAHTKLTDTTSGFKACGRRAIALFSVDYPAEYLGDTVEALVIAARSGLVLRQRPSNMRVRQGGTPSHSPWKAAVFLGRAFLALAVAVCRPAPRGVHE